MSRDRSESPPPIPVLGMLIDRTSFDETDDFCIDPLALESPEYPSHDAGNPARQTAIIMKNGKVRRRLRWRPKNLMKRRRTSDVSVASVASRTSRKSVHSFASTETLQKSNTRKSKNAIFGRSSSKFPLPRPNYPGHFDGVATIGTEGGMVHARMTPDRMLDSVEEVISEGNTDDEDESFDPYRSPLEQPVTKATRRKGVLPPLFQPGGASSKRKPIPSSIFTTEGTPSPAKKGGDALTPSTAASSRSGELESPESIPLPALPGDDVDRQVDLRIPRSPMVRKDNISSLSSKPLQLIIPSFVNEPESGTRNRVAELESLDSLDSDDDLSKEEEARFSMSKTISSPSSQTLLVGDKAPNTIPERRSAGPVDLDDDVSLDHDEGIKKDGPQIRSKPRTGPVDLDDGAFVQVEKNLQAIHEMATEHLQQGEYTEALEVFQEILRGQLARYGEYHYRVGIAHHNIGIVHTKRGDYLAAIQSYKEAVRIRQKILEPNHPDVGVSLAQLGVAYLEINKHRRALVAFRESLKIRRRCYGNCHPKVAKILNNIGCALYELDELEVAQVAFEEALIIQRSLLRDTSVEQADSYQRQLLGVASTQSNLASIKLIHGEFDAAAVDLEEALLVQQCVLSDDHPVVKRTQESLLWIEKAKISPHGMLSSVETAKSCLIHTPGACGDDELSKQEKGEPSESSPHTVMGLLEEQFMALRANFDFGGCGGEGDTLSDDDDKEVDDLSSESSSASSA